MAGCNFLFDVVVSHFESAKSDVHDISKLDVIVQFNGKPIKITPSRINVTDFKPNTGLDFKADPQKLRKNLEECGMPITVNYNARVLGTGLIGFPPMVIDRIQDGMSDLMHVDICNIEKEGEILAKVEILCRLVIKCLEQPKDENQFCRNMDRSIAQQDIMFVVSESQRCPSNCDPCQDLLEPEEGDDNLKLDMLRYRSFSTGAMKEIFTHNPAGNAACCELKKMALECEQLVDSITKASGQPKPLKAPCRRPQELDDPCFASGPGVGYYPREEHPLTSPHVPCFSYLPARDGEDPDFCSPNLIPVPISDIAKPMVKPIRFCPICLTNMSWLPKFANCPTCGVKPMPIVEKRHKEKKLTADDIMHELLGTRRDDDYCIDPCAKPKDDDEDEPQCRCTCKFGKLCAHCRIRKLVADIFQASKNEFVCPKVKPKSSEDFSVIENDDTNCRPYLARVFSELRDLYSLKDTKQPTEPDELPQKKIILPDKKPQVSGPDHKPIPKEHKPVERKRTVLGAGHKFCVNPLGAVSRKHGWAWQLGSEAKQHGWRPGAVRKSVRKLMKFFLQYSPAKNAFNQCKKRLEAEKEKERQLPTLNVCKKNGEIYITLRPLNDPNIEMKPIIFKIAKSDLAVATRQIKKKLKQKGFRKCTCHQTLMMCVCRSNAEKKQLESAVIKESKRHGIENCVDNIVLTDTSDSEMEFDFDVTPPAGLAKRLSKRRRITINNGTQTNKKDLKIIPKYPVQLNPYYRAYDCAAGDRYTGTAFGSPGEAVFEDGVFGFRGGGPHGASATPGGKSKPAGIWGSSPGGPHRGGGRAAAAGGGGPGGPGGHGGGPGGAFGGKSFPGAKKTPGDKVKSPPIPVKMTQRHYKAVAAAEKAKKDAVKHALEKKKKGTNLLDYLMERGSVAKPWDPNNPIPKGQPKTNQPVYGEDGLTDAQRRRRELNRGPIPPLDSMPRLGKGYEPCGCYNPCHDTCYYPCCYYG